MTKEEMKQEALEVDIQNLEGIKLAQETALNTEYNINADLKAQIEKMKCCWNCKHFDFNEPKYCRKGVFRERLYVCSDWEFRN